MANNGKKWQGRVLSPARLLPLATVPRVHFTFMRCPLNLNPAPPLRLGLKMRKKPPKNVECAPVRAHLATTTSRYANSLAPRSGERARERGSFPPMVVMLRCVRPVARKLPNRVQSCIIVHNRAIFWVKPSWIPDSACSPRFLPSPVIQSGGWPQRSPPRHPHELALRQRNPILNKTASRLSCLRLQFHEAK